MMDYRPQTVTDAQFSLPWTMAAVAAGLSPGADWYTEQNMQNPELLGLADKVTAFIDPDFTARMTGPARQPGARVVLTHVNGNRSVEERFKPLGSLERPISESDVIAKARLNLRGQNVNAEALLTRVMQQHGSDRVLYSSAAGLTAALIQ
jgi:2-methylcitrate dehydratase PrpD